MSPVKEDEIRKYTVRLKDGVNVSIKAHQLTRPTTKHPYFVFKLDDQIIAEYLDSEIAGWRVD